MVKRAGEPARSDGRRTTLADIAAEAGTAAARMLDELIAGRPPHPNRMELSTELTVRSSTLAALALLPD